MQWREEDGTLFNIDCDLMRERPVGWFEEFSKLEDMGPARSSHHPADVKELASEVPADQQG